MKKILIVEDCDHSFILIKRCLQELYHLVQAKSLAGAQAQLASGRFDLVLLDLHLPDGDGLQLCSTLRTSEAYDRLPIIVLSARTTTPDQVAAFACGADDYVYKPFAPEELQARVGAKLREKAAKEALEFKIRVGDLEIDQAAQRVVIRKNGKTEEVILTALELKILMLLSKQKNRVLSRNEILDMIWGNNVHVFARNVDTHISKLRKKLGDLACYIKSAHGKGYSFAPPETPRLVNLPFVSQAPRSI